MSSTRPRIGTALAVTMGWVEECTMLRQCAWCGQSLGMAEPLDDPRVTHGICLACAEHVLEEHRQTCVVCRVVSAETVSLPDRRRETVVIAD
jgi:hypothetical protein